MDSPMVITLGQQYNVGEKPTVVRYICIIRHARTAEKAKAGIRHAVVCPNVTRRIKKRIAQSKLALVD